jgi:anti-anti-sigma factor
MRVQVQEPGQRMVLAGRLGAATVADIRQLLHDAVDDGAGDLVLDLSQVELADASGLGLLVAVHRRAGRNGRRLVLVAVPGRMGRALAMTRLHRVLNLEGDGPRVA